MRKISLQSQRKYRSHPFTLNVCDVYAVHFQHPRNWLTLGLFFFFFFLFIFCCYSSRKDKTIKPKTYIKQIFFFSTSFFFEYPIQAIKYSITGHNERFFFYIFGFSVGRRKFLNLNAVLVEWRIKMISRTTTKTQYHPWHS